MFSSNRGLFPAYSGLGDIQVELPTPPSRSKIARDVEDLWDIHTSEPHVTAASDPGIAVPYPDDHGYDPRGLPDDSEVNQLINRAAEHLTSTEQKRLLSQLHSMYTDRLVTNLQMSSMDVGAIKEMMQNQCAGSLLVYNGNDKDSLIKAYTLIQSLENLVESFVRNSTFSEDAKAEMLSFVAPCPAVRDAMVLPEHLIRQRLFGSTESRDNIAHALDIFGLDDDSVMPGRRINPLDEEFKDYLEKIDFAELELDRSLQKDMHEGLSHAAMYNALNQVLPNVSSKETRDALTSVILGVRRAAEDKSKRTSRSLALLITKLKQDLEKIGIDPRSVDRLVARERAYLQESQQPSKTPSSPDVMGPRDSQRSPQELARLYNDLMPVIRNMQQALKSRRMAPEAKTCCVVEMYTLLCIRDCCAALASGESLDPCAENLRSAVETELKSSDLPSIKSLKLKLDKSHKDLQSAKKSKTMESLNKAKSESLISDKKLETLRQIIG